MFKVSDIPDQVLRDIAGAYHRRLLETDTEGQPEAERDFQRIAYLRTALEWLALWHNQQSAAAQPVACQTCEELRNDLSDALGGRLHTDDEKSRIIDGLIAQLSDISDALGISAEEQACANGAEEILAAIEELKAAQPVAVPDGELIELLEELNEYVDEPPRANCSCHIAPPCGDCIDYSHLRDVKQRVASVLAFAQAKGGAQ